MTNEKEEGLCLQYNPKTLFFQQDARYHSQVCDASDWSLWLSNRKMEFEGCSFFSTVKATANVAAFEPHIRQCCYAHRLRRPSGSRFSPENNELKKMTLCASCQRFVSNKAGSFRDSLLRTLCRINQVNCYLLFDFSNFGLVGVIFIIYLF